MKTHSFAFVLALSFVASGAELALAQDRVVVAGQDGVAAPKRTKTIQPVYPQEALAQGIRGIVILEVLIDTQGQVASADVIRSIPGLDEAALTAVRKWEYEVTKIDGQPVNVKLTVPITFAVRLPEVTRAPGIPELRQGASIAYPAGPNEGGSVIAEVTLARDGQVAEAEVTKGDAPWTQALLQALRTWRFASEGDNVTLAFRVEADFVPGKGEKGRVDVRLTGLRRSESAPPGAGAETASSSPEAANAPSPAPPSATSAAPDTPPASGAPPVPIVPVPPDPIASPTAPAPSAADAPASAPPATAPAAPANPPSAPATPSSADTTPPTGPPTAPTATAPTAPAAPQPPSSGSAPAPEPPITPPATTTSPTADAPRVPAPVTGPPAPTNVRPGSPAATDPKPGATPPPVEVITAPRPPGSDIAPPPSVPGVSAIRDVTLAMGVPDLVRGRRPVPPPIARMTGTTGTVEVKFGVDAAGVTSVTEATGPDELKTAATYTVQSWFFRRVTAERLHLVASFEFAGEVAKGTVRSE